MFNISKDKTAYKFFPRPNTDNEIKSLPHGLYSVENVGFLVPEYVFHQFKMKEKIVEPISSEPYKQIKKAVLNFFNPKLKELYKKLEYLNKKGILVHGNPGTGKTASITNLVNNILVENQAVGLQLKYASEVHAANTFISMLRAEEPDLCIVLIFDECENYFTRHETENFLLNFLDGYDSKNNVLSLFITNKLEMIPTRFTDRPSRIRDVIEYNSTPYEVLLEILTSKIPEEYHTAIDIKGLAFKYSEANETIDKAKTKVIGLLEDLVLKESSKEATVLN